MQITEFDSHKVALIAIGEGSESLLTPTDRAYIATLAADKRRAEQLAWRTALRSLIGSSAEIGYLPSGAPHLIGSEWQISVSHNTHYAAVAIGPTKCGIDIESTARNFARVASRYISSHEELLPESSHPLFRPLLWSAKEAIYKYVAAEGVDFLQDIIITAVDIPHCTIRAEFRGTPLPEILFKEVGGNNILCLIR